jgi:hypothetical protein
MRHPRWLPVSCLVIAAAAPAAAAERRSADLWGEVRLLDPQTAGAVRRALTGAAGRLRKQRCQELLFDYRDQQGRPLQARLSELGVDAAGHLRGIVFREGWGTGQCESNERLAFTRPGASTVWVCGGKFEHAMATNSRWAEATIIHEALHTLGLGEGPSPISSLAITRRVLDRCGR